MLRFRSAIITSVVTLNMQLFGAFCHYLLNRCIVDKLYCCCAYALKYFFRLMSKSARDEGSDEFGFESIRGWFLAELVFVLCFLELLSCYELPTILFFTQRMPPQESDMCCLPQEFPVIYHYSVNNWYSD